MPPRLLTVQRDANQYTRCTFQYSQVHGLMTLEERQYHTTRKRGVEISKVNVIVTFSIWLSTRGFDTQTRGGILSSLRRKKPNLSSSCFSLYLCPICPHWRPSIIPSYPICSKIYYLFVMQLGSCFRNILNRLDFLDRVGLLLQGFFSVDLFVC